MPVVSIIAGPNGTGKTTFYSIAVANGFINPSLPFINVDLIAKSLGGYTEKNFARAQEIYRERVKEHIDNKEDFMIESNLAESRSYDWIASMKRSGFEVSLYYLSTEDVEVNIGRVNRRVAEGGHDIPEPIIRSRYTQSHSYLKTKLSEFQEVYLIDNTTDIFHVHAILVNGMIMFKSSNASQWVCDVLSILERLQGRMPKDGG